MQMRRDEAMAQLNDLNATVHESSNAARTIYWVQRHKQFARVEETGFGWVEVTWHDTCPCYT